METESPTTKSKPLATSTGILVKGKKKIGRNTIIKNKAKNEILSKMFDNMIFKKNLLIIKNLFHFPHNNYCITLIKKQASFSKY